MMLLLTSVHPVFQAFSSENPGQLLDEVLLTKPVDYTPNLEKRQSINSNMLFPKVGVHPLTRYPCCIPSHDTLVDHPQTPGNWWDDGLPSNTFTSGVFAAPAYMALLQHPEILDAMAEANITLLENPNHGMCCFFLFSFLFQAHQRMSVACCNHALILHTTCTPILYNACILNSSPCMHQRTCIHMYPPPGDTVVNLAQVMQPFWRLLSNSTLINSISSDPSEAQIYLQQVVLPIFEHLNKGQVEWAAGRNESTRTYPLFPGNFTAASVQG